MKALDDLLWLKARLEDERDFAIHAHTTFATGPEAAKRILAWIQPAIDDLRRPEGRRLGIAFCAEVVRFLCGREELNELQIEQLRYSAMRFKKTLDGV